MRYHTHTPFYQRAVFTILVLAVSLTLGINMAYAGNDGGNSLQFDGVNDYVIAPLNGTTLTQVTVEMWIKPNPLTWGGIFQWADQLSAGSAFMIFNYSAPGGFQAYVDGGNNLSTTTPHGVWTHIAVTYDGTTWRLYRNGLLVGTYTGGIGGYRANASNVYFGNGYGDGSSFYWNGQIDEARIWNVARTQSEIQANMYEQLPGSPYPAGLTAYYQFNTASGTTAIDSTVGGHNGTLTNMAGNEWIASTAPLSNLTAYQTGITAMWSGQVSTTADGIATGLDITDIGFLNDVGDDIIFAHNNVAFANLTTDLPSGVDKRWSRVWELDVNDAAGTTGGNVGLTFDISDAGGQGNFDSGGTYFLLGRAAGSNNVFAIIPVVSTSVIGDQLTFTVNASNLGSEFTLGATTNSPTALRLQTLSAQSKAGVQMVLPLGMALMVLGGAALVWRRRRSV